MVFFVFFISLSNIKKMLDLNINFVFCCGYENKLKIQNDGTGKKMEIKIQSLNEENQMRFSF